MAEIKNTIGVAVGRFQTPYLHKGHSNIIDTLIKNHNEVLIVLGISRLKHDPRDPLDYETRRAMLIEYFKTVEGSWYMQGKTFTVLGLIDVGYHRNNLWSEQLDALIHSAHPGKKAILYGSRDSFIPYYHGIHEVKEIKPLPDVNATDIRKAVASRFINSADFRRGVVYGISNQFPSVNMVVDGCVWRYKVTSQNLQWAMIRRNGSNVWSFVGGYVDPKDVSLEQAIIREVWEELGLTDLGKIQYKSSMNIPDWRYKGSIHGMVGAFYLVQYSMGILNVRDKTEDIAEAKWMDVPRNHEEMTNWINNRITPNHQAYAQIAWDHFNELSKHATAE